MRESFLSYFEQMVRIEVLLGLRWMFGKPVLARKTVFRNDICAEKPANPLNSLAFREPMEIYPSHFYFTKRLDNRPNFPPILSVNNFPIYKDKIL